MLQWKLLLNILLALTLPSNGISPKYQMKTTQLPPVTMRFQQVRIAKVNNKLETFRRAMACAVVGNRTGTLPTGLNRSPAR